MLKNISKLKKVIYIKNNKIILELKEPMITSYTAYANFLGILESYPETWGWIYTNMINLWTEIIEENGQIDTPFRFSSWILMARCPFFEYSVLPQYVYSGLENYPINFLEMIIEKGYFSTLSYDTYYIPHSKNYNKNHWTHQLFIRGFDKSKKKIFVADFFDGKFDYREISYEDLKSSIQSELKINKGPYIIIYKYRTESLANENGAFDKNLFLSKLEDYLDSRYVISNIEGHLLSDIEIVAMKNKKIKFGVSYYKELQKVLDFSIDKDYVDIRPFHVLYDHKIIICRCIDYLFQHNIFSDKDKISRKSEELKSKTLIMRNLYSKTVLQKEKRNMIKLNL